MEQKTTIDFKALSNWMRKDLIRVNKLRKLVRCLVCIFYSSVLVWFGLCIFTLINQTSTLEWQYTLTIFGILFVSHYVYLKSFMVLNKQENNTMNKIIVGLFPSARYTPTGTIKSQILATSRLFATPSSSGNSIDTTGYGRVDIPIGDQCMSIADVGVTSANTKDFSILNPLEVLYQYFVRPIFGARVESSMHSFRGMFGYCKMQHSVRGYVMLLPDHLENQIGYLAQTVQGFKLKYGAKFVYMEDPEFEKLFIVYADDEVEARMILTPAMMRRLTELRKSFSRDLMFSFNGNTFYYASDTADGFLRPGRKSLDNEHLLEQLYHEIDFCRTIEKELR